MTELMLGKTLSGQWAAYDPITQEFTDKCKPGTVIHADFKKTRNPRFHAKFFSLLNLGFQYWEPGEITSKYGIPEKNFDRFRKDVIIMAGYYYVVARLDGSVRVEAKSISFANMEEGEFEKLYNAVLNVLLRKIDMLKQMGPEEIDRITNQLLDFG